MWGEDLPNGWVSCTYPFVKITVPEFCYKAKQINKKIKIDVLDITYTTIKTQSAKTIQVSNTIA